MPEDILLRSELEQRCSAAANYNHLSPGNLRICLPVVSVSKPACRAAALSDACKLLHLGDVLRSSAIGDLAR